MNIHHTLTEGTNSSTLPVAVDTRLHGRWLVLARVVWVAVAGLILVLIVASIPAEFKFLLCHANPFAWACQPGE